jgi:hypothetical protein
VKENASVSENRETYEPRLDRLVVLTDDINSEFLQIPCKGHVLVKERIDYPCHFDYM